MKRAWKVTLWALAGLLGVVLLVVAAGFVLLRSDGGRSWLAAQIESAVSEPGGLGLSIGVLEGALPGEILLRDVTLSDPQGVWLTLDRARLAWSPSLLLTGRFAVEELVAGKLAVARAPELPLGEATEDDEPFALPSLPVEVTLERLLVERLELGEALLGAPAALRIVGAAGARRAEGLTTALEVERLDGVAGRIALDAGLDPTGRILRVDLSASEPPGGVIARLLALPDLPAVEARLQGEGPLDDWRGELSGSLAGLAEWQGEVSLAAAGEPRRATLDGTANLHLDPAAPLGALLVGEQSLHLEAALAEDQTLTVESLRLESPVVALTAAGRLQLESLESELTASLAVKQPASLPYWPEGIAVEGLALDAASEGPLLQPRAKVILKADALALAGARLDGVSLTLLAQSRDPLTDPDAQLDFQGDLALDAFAVEGLAPETIEGIAGPGLGGDFAGSLDLGAQSLELDELSVESGLASAGGSGAFDLAGPVATLGVDLGLSDLAPLAPLLGLPLTGEASLHLGLEDARLDEALSVPFRLTASGLSTGIAQADQVLGPAPEVSGTLVLSAEGALQVTGLRIAGENATVTGEAALDAAFETLEADYGIEVPRLSALSEAAGSELAGSLSASGKASGALADPNVTLEASAAGLRAAGLDLGEVALSLNADSVVSGPSGDLALRLSAPAVAGGGALTLDSGFRLEGETLSLSGLALSGASTELTGELAYRLDSGIAEGTLQGRSGDLATLLGLAGLEGSGQGVFAATLGARAGKQAAAMTAELNGLSLSPADAPPETPALTIDRLTAEARSPDIAALAGTASAQATGLALDELVLEELGLEAQGGTQALGWSLAAKGRYRDPLSVTATGRVALAESSITGSIDSLEGGAMSLPFKLQAPLALAQGEDGDSPAGKRMSFSGLDLEVAGGRIAGAGSIEGAAVEARLTVADFPLSAARHFAELPELEGSLGASLTLSGEAPAPEGRLEIDVEDLQTREVSDAPPLQIALTGDWSGGRAAIEGRVSGLGENAATLNLALPLRLDPETMTPALPAEGPLEGAFEWAGPIDQIWPLVPVGDQLLSGDAALSAQVTGTLDAPVASGGVTLERGRYENLSTGTLLTDLELQVSLTGRQAVIERLEASDGGRGRLTVTGSAELLPEQGFPFDLAARFDELTVTRRDEVTAAVDGSLDIEGTIDDSDVVGRFETRGVEIRIPNRLPPEVVELEVREINRASGGQSPETPEEEAAAEALEEPPGPRSVTLDVAVVLPGRVFVRGRGLESEWRGDVAVTGSAAAPRVAGELNLVRGQLSVLGRSFDLTRGRISFPGGAEIDPLLDIVAESESDDVTVIVSLFGTPSRPDISFSSRPPLPQDEVLARVLFDKNTTQLSPFEAIQLAGAAAELSGRGSGGGGVLDFARNLVGVDVLRLESGGSESDLPGVSAGKYVTDDVYVGVKQGATAGSGSVGVEVELTPNISVDSGVTQRGSSNVGLKFKWDY